MNRITKIILVTLILISCLYARATVFAAEIRFEAYTVAGSSSDFLIKLLLSTSGEEVNAIEGRITFPEDLLEVKEIHDGDSSINFWIEKPHFNRSEGILFSGITPGGFIGENKLIFSTVFHQKSSLDGKISIDTIKILRNDGQGSPMSVKLATLDLPIHTKLEVSSINDGKIQDTTPPESFQPDIVKNEDMFDGKYTLIFATQDKESGVGHYEVREGYLGKYKIALSPYTLENQSANKIISVKAIDNAGNEMVARFYPPNYTPWYRQYGIIAILLIIILVILRKKWLRFIK